MAEIIRQLDSYAPGALSRYLELSAIQEQTQIIEDLKKKNDETVSAFEMLQKQM